MKIVHVCMGFPVEYPGGITNYVRSLASSQAIANEVTVVCNGNSTSKLMDCNYNIIRYNSPIENFSLNLDAKDECFSDFYSILKNEKADIYHFHSLLGIDLRFLKRWDLNNYVVSLHDYNTICPRISMVKKNGTVCSKVDLDSCASCVSKLEQIPIIQRVSNKLKIPLPLIKSNNVYHRHSLFIRFLNDSLCCFPVSRRVSDIFIASGLCQNKSKIITIGNESASGFEKRTPTLTDKIKVAFLGNFIKIKGAELYIDILKKMVSLGFEFHLYGRGDATLINKFEASGGIYHGSYSPDQLSDILKNVDIGAVLPIWEDNGPQVVMEFINNGVPVLGTERGGIPDFIEHNRTGFLFDPDDKCSAIDWLLSMNKDKLQNIMGNIKPLKTPSQHVSELNAEYFALIN